LIKTPSFLTTKVFFLLLYLPMYLAHCKNNRCFVSELAFLIFKDIKKQLLRSWPNVLRVLFLRHIKMIKVWFLPIQRSLMGFEYILSPPPIWLLWIATMWKFLHGILVSTKNPFVYTSITVHCQETIVAPPHFHSWVIFPAVRISLESSPYLISFYTLFTKSAIIKRFCVFDQIGGSYKRIYHLR